MYFFKNLPLDVLNLLFEKFTQKELSGLCLVDKFINQNINDSPVWKKLAQPLILPSEQSPMYKKLVLRYKWFLDKHGVNPRIYTLPIKINPESLFMDKHSSAHVTKVENGDFSTMLKDDRVQISMDFDSKNKLMAFFKLSDLENMVTHKSYVKQVPILDVIKTLY